MQITRILPLSYHSATQSIVQNAKSIAIIAALAAIAFAVLRYYYLTGTPKIPPKNLKKNPPLDTPIKLATPHPAEQPAAYNIVDQLPQELICTIFNMLKQNSLLAAQLAQQSWCRLADTSWECRLKAHFGPTVAQTLKESHASWREVVLFVNRPIEVKSNRLADIKLAEIVSDQNAIDALKKVRKLARTHNFEELQGTLEALRSFGFEILNQSIKKKTSIRKITLFCNSEKLDNATTPLQIAAASGIVKNAQLLVENGSTDVVWNPPTNNFKKLSTLFIAASHGHVDMVHYLLEQGAQPDLYIKDPLDGIFQLILTTMISRGSKKEPQGKFLECLILILNAGKGKIGIESLRTNKHAEYVLNAAFKDGYSAIADLLMSYGIRPRQENFWSFRGNGAREWAENGIIYNNLPMLELLHRRQLFNFIQFRDINGHTLLAMATACNNTAALKFLQEIGVPNVIGKDGKSDFEIGRERLIKSRLIAILDGIFMLDTVRPYFSDSRKDIVLNSIARMEPDCYLLNYISQPEIDLNTPLDDGKNTLLYYVVKEIFNSFAREYITKIMNYGANPHQAGISGITPLMEAERIYQEKQAEKSEEDCLGALAIIQSMKEYQDSH